MTTMRSRVSARARRVWKPPGAVLLAVLVVVLATPGWVAAKLWYALVWAASAVAEGWIAARPDKPG